MFETTDAAVKVRTALVLWSETIDEILRLTERYNLTRTQYKQALREYHNLRDQGLEPAIQEQEKGNPHPLNQYRLADRIMNHPQLDVVEKIDALNALVFKD